MESPRPVPPYLRLVEPSAWAKDSKIDCCFSNGMPVPLSMTLNTTTSDARLSASFDGLQPDAAISAMNSTRPFSVNSKVPASFLKTISKLRAQIIAGKIKPPAKP